MMSGCRIRVTSPPKNNIVSLQLIQSTTILFVGTQKLDEYFPKTEYRYQIVRGVSLSSLLTEEFFRNNTATPEEIESLKKQSKNKSKKKSQLESDLVGVVLNSPLDVANSAALFHNQLRLSVDTFTRDSIGLIATRSAQSESRTPPAFRRTTAIDVSLVNPSKAVRKRTEWALSKERIGTVDVALSCGSAYVYPPNPNCGVKNYTMKYTQHHRTSLSSCVPNMTRIIEHGDDDDLLELIDYIQLKCSEDENELQIPTETEITLSSITESTEVEQRVDLQIHRYTGLSGGEFGRDVISCMQKAVEQGCRSKEDFSWCAVLMRGFADAPLLWKHGGGTHRGGCARGFGGDAAEIAILRPNKAPLMIQLRAQPDVR